MKWDEIFTAKYGMSFEKVQTALRKSIWNSFCQNCSARDMSLVETHEDHAIGKCYGCDSYYKFSFSNEEDEIKLTGLEQVQVEYKPTGKTYSKKKGGDDDEPETYDLENVEIFAVGTWNGDKYSDEDIDDLVNNTNALLEKVQPYAKLGHDDNQVLLQMDGYPAAGWITKLKRKGKKVLADFTNVPKAIYKLIKNRAYKRVSSEIFWNFKDTETNNVYSRVLKAVAFLGGDTPAVTTLKDIEALYGSRDPNIKVVTFSGEHDVRTVSFSIEEPNQNQGGKKTMDPIEFQGKKYTQDEFQAILDKAKQAEDAERRMKEYARQQQEKDIDSFIQSQKEKGRILPAHEGLVKTLMQSVQENQVVRYSDKEVAPLELFKKYIEALPELVKFTEVSAGSGKEEGKDGKFEDAVQKYSTEQKVSYTEAVKIVARQEPELFDDYQKRMRGEA